MSSCAQTISSGGTGIIETDTVSARATLLCQEQPSEAFLRDSPTLSARARKAVHSRETHSASVSSLIKTIPHYQYPKVGLYLRQNSSQSLFAVTEAHEINARVLGEGQELSHNRTLLPEVSF